MPKVSFHNVGQKFFYYKHLLRVAINLLPRRRAIIIVSIYWKGETGYLFHLYISMVIVQKGWNDHHRGTKCQNHWDVFISFVHVRGDVQCLYIYKEKSNLLTVNGERRRIRQLYIIRFYTTLRRSYFIFSRFFDKKKKPNY